MRRNRSGPEWGYWTRNVVGLILARSLLRTPWGPGGYSVSFLSSCLAEPQNDCLEGVVLPLLGSVGGGLFAVGCTVMCSKYAGLFTPL